MMNSGGSTSTSVSGTITSADLKGPLAGKQITDLIRLIEDGKAYVNIHTDQNSNGKIRGQLKSSSP
jgi:CHRD domain-containing protein